MKHVFIVNPAAGRADASVALVPPMIERLAPLGLDYAIELTERPGHATDLARRYAMAREPVRFYACGGDGTLNEVMEAAYQYPQAEVACVPVGSGNDMVRNFGKVSDFLDIPDLVAGTAVPIDLMKANGRICVSLSSMGLDANVASEMPRFRRLPMVSGSAAYKLSIVENLCLPIGAALSITVDGQTRVGRYLIAVIANGSYYGGGVCAAPQARVDDGVLDIVTVKKVSRLKIASVLGRYMKGNHMQGDKVAEDLAGLIEVQRGKHVIIQPEKPVMVNIDGECTPQMHLEVKCLPLAGRFVLPSKLYQARLIAQEATLSCG
ncbi:MAG: diacylglycerol kinase family lipid kinase [Pygmaiobacter massiliensis]|nr:diacylglycerol kinase family lipid kinase [Pygmaiobacter massiliensis]